MRLADSLLQEVEQRLGFDALLDVRCRECFSGSLILCCNGSGLADELGCKQLEAPTCRTAQRRIRSGHHPMSQKVHACIPINVRAGVATRPTSSSTCIIFLILACEWDNEERILSVMASTRERQQAGTGLTAAKAGFLASDDAEAAAIF